MDLFNLRSKNNNNSNSNKNANSLFPNNKSSSQVNLSMPGSPPPPTPPSKEAIWKSKGMFGRQPAVCIEDDYRILPQQNIIVPAPAPTVPVPASTAALASRPAALLSTAVSQEQLYQSQKQEIQGRHQGHNGHTDADRVMHDRGHAHTVVELNNHNRPMQCIDVSLPLRSPSPSLVPLSTAQSRTESKKPYESLQQQKIPLPPLQQQLQQGTRLTSTMSTDISRLSISSLQDDHDDDSSSSIESDHSLIMEDVFEVYDNFSVELSSNDNSRQSSMRNVPLPAVVATTTAEVLAAHQRRESSGDWTIDRYHQQQRQQQLDSAELHPRPPAPEPSDKKPLSALERIKRQQKRQSQEQERLAELVLPQELMSKPNLSKTGLAGPGADHVLPVREVPLDRIPIQALHPLATASQVSPLPLIQQQMQQKQQKQQQRLQGSGESGESGGAEGLAPTDPGAAIIGTDSAMLDQLLTLIPGPNRPRLPTQVEWQQGIEELRQRRKDAAALTNSVGRQNSSGSRHSQDSSADGKSRRHSMPDMPHGQSREDQERQRGDHFRNPMLLSNNDAYPSLTSTALNSNAAQKRRLGFEDREQQLLQPPIQRQSIAEAQAMDVSKIHTEIPIDPKKAGRKRAGKNGVALDNVPGQGAHAAASETASDRVDKDVIDIAFNEMLTTLSLPPATVAQLESLSKDRKWAMLQSKDANASLLQTPQTMPPQFFVDLLLEYAGKMKRSSRDQFAFNVAAMTATSAATTPTTPTRPMGMWKNFSATNLTGNGNWVNESGFSTKSSSASKLSCHLMEA
ncbi:hypothetical protein BGW39_011621 [Mortierella sp. 14UC]|nr:hypothetical protein BGW39_011621 [Mortierella sp. 14UC]